MENFSNESKFDQIIGASFNDDPDFEARNNFDRVLMRKNIVSRFEREWENSGIFDTVIDGLEDKDEDKLDLFVDPSSKTRMRLYDGKYVDGKGETVTIKGVCLTARLEDSDGQERSHHFVAPIISEFNGITMISDNFTDDHVALLNHQFELAENLYEDVFVSEESDSIIEVSDYDPENSL